MTSSNIVKNSLFNIIKTIITMILPIITFAYVSRILGAEGIGIVNFSRYYTSFFCYIAQLGVPAYATREIAKFKGDVDKISKFSHEMLFINFISTLIALVLLFFSMICVSKLHNYKYIIMIFALTIVMQGMGMEWLFQGTTDFVYISVRTILFQVLSLVLLFITVKNEKDIMNYAFVVVLSRTGSYVVNWVKSKKYIKYKIYNDYEIKKHLYPIMWLYAINLVNEIYGILDTVILGLFQDDSSVGRYTAASKLGSAVNQMFIALATVMLPYISIVIKSNDKNKLEELVKRFIRITFFLCIPIAFLLFSLSKEIIVLLCGKEFENSYITMRIITLIIFVVPVNVIIIYVITAIGREKKNIFASIIAASVNLFLNIMFIPKYSENAASITTVIAETLSMIIGILNLRRCTGIKGIAFDLYQYVIAAIPILMWFYFFGAMGFTSLIKIISVGVMSMITYFYILKVFGNDILVFIKEYSLDFIKKLRKVY